MNTFWNWRGFSILLILIGASGYGMLSPLIKLAFEEGHLEGDITSAQATMGMAIMWLLVLVTPAARRSPFTGPWVKLALIGMFGLSLTSIFYNRTLAELDASLSIVLLFQFTWITILMECVASRKWPTPYQSIAVLIVMIGTILSVNLFGADLGRFNAKGLIFGLASAVTYSLFLFAAGRVESSHHPFLKSAWMMTAGTAVIYLFYPPVFLAGTGVDPIPLLVWGAVLGVVGQVVPTVSFIIGIPRVGSTLAAMLGALELPVAVIGALLMLGENVVLIQWMGMVLILGGVLVSEIRVRGEKEAAE
jgi:drug/metabolite transporter (DMT)-like permease